MSVNYLASFDSLHLNTDSVSRPGSTENFSPKFEFNSLLCEDTLEGLGHLTVDTHATNGVEELNCGHLSTEP